EAPAAPARPKLALVKEPPPTPVEPAAAPAVPAGLNETDTAVLQAVVDGATRQKDVVERTGMRPGTVSKAVSRLVTSGHLLKAEDKSLSLPAEEVTA
ncbi:MarR family transcriptional regulator, partial [Streptomyces diastaticus]|uniref:MarR family transcriptional regulator n=1 Tax=Streptomyces diastaticus TaxID=1956 RepID=UPI0036B2B2E0